MAHILAVDDEEVIRDLVQRTLAIDGNYEIRLADDGQAALDKVAQSVPDLVLLDLCLGGGLDGLQVCRILQREYGRGCPKVVLLTGTDQQEVREACLEAGAAAYLTKPFSPLELIQQVETILEVSDVD